MVETLNFGLLMRCSFVGGPAALTATGVPVTGAEGSRLGGEVEAPVVCGATDAPGRGEGGTLGADVVLFVVVLGESGAVMRADDGRIGGTDNTAADCIDGTDELSTVK